MTTIKVELKKKDLQKLYNKLCVKPDTTDEKDMWCQDCPLSKIEWVAYMADVYKNDRFGEAYISGTKPIIRNLCFAIWHDEILTKNPEHYHHNF